MPANRAGLLQQVRKAMTLKSVVVASRCVLLHGGLQQTCFLSSTPMTRHVRERVFFNALHVVHVEIDRITDRKSVV